MKVQIQVQIFFLVSITSVIGQSTDTIQFDRFKGIICDSITTPFESRNIFPKNRFTPNRVEIEEVEVQLLKQYGQAFKKYYEISYEQYKPVGLTNEEQKKSELSFTERLKTIPKIKKRIKKEYKDYDRNYYGYIGLNGMRYIRVEFQPHKEKWIETPDTGESHLYNLPILVYNLKNNKLSLLGWTGERDE
jgi:hypothetical protein